MSRHRPFVFCGVYDSSPSLTLLGLPCSSVAGPPARCGRRGHRAEGVRHISDTLNFMAEHFYSFLFIPMRDSSSQDKSDTNKPAPFDLAKLARESNETLLEHVEQVRQIQDH